MPTKILFGRGILSKVGEEASKLGSKALIATGGRSMRESGFLNIVLDSLKEKGVEAVVFGKVEPNPSVETVMEGANVAREEKCNLIIGLGGGSSLDAAKGIAIAVTHKGSIWDYVEGNPQRKEITKETLPILAIPSTSGTGSETTPYAVITHKGEKLKDTLVSPHIYPKVAIIDPEIPTKMPPELTAYTGADAFCHGLEGFTSRKAQPVTDILALDALSRLIKYLPKVVAYGEDIEAREQVAWAATEAGIVIGQTGCTLCHAMAHPVSAHFNVPHGLACTLLTTFTLRFNLRGNLEKYAKISKLFGLHVKGLPIREAAEATIKLVEKFIFDIGIRTSLAEAGVKFEGIQRMAEDTLKMGALKCNMIQPSIEEIKVIFNEALNWKPQA
jgi:alcohol dehydrogenase class IV